MRLLLLLFRRAPKLQIRAAATKGAPPLSRHILPGKRSAGLPGVDGGGSLCFLFFCFVLNARNRHTRVCLSRE